MRRGLLLAVAAVLIGWTLPARPAAQAQDARARPSRIVSLVPATTEMLFAIGAGSRVVGVGSYDRYPPQVERLPRVGGLLDPSVEQIIALHPDLVIVYRTQAELQRQLEGARIATWSYDIRGLADVTATMRELGRRIGIEREAGAAASQMESRLNAVSARVSGRPRVRTLLLFGREPGTLRGINASGGYGFLHDLLQLAGGADVLGDIKQAAVSMSTEMVIARAPDAIVELHYGDAWPAARIEAERRVWLALPSVPAVRNKRVYVLTGDEFVVPGPRLVSAAERLAQVLHPESGR